MTRSATRPLANAIVSTLLGLGLGVVPSTALAQTPKPPAPPAKPGTQASKPPTKPAAKRAKKPAETRFRLVANFTIMPSTLSYDDVRSTTTYAETGTIRTSYEAGTGLGADGALQASFYRGLGLLAGYSYVRRDVTGTADVTRPHPLYLDRPRTASAELSGYGYTEGAFDLDAAYARSAGHLDWALFAGVTLFSVEADLLDVPTFDEKYPYDQLTILGAPSGPIKENATGWNVGGRLDYRFGKSKSFGVGVQVRYSNASVELNASQATTPASIDAGGLSFGAGVRAYF